MLNRKLFSRYLLLLIPFLTLFLARGSAQQLTVSCTLPANAQVGVAYNGSCSASGGSGSYSYSISSGSLPNPLTIDQNSGAITGTPSASGTSSFTVSATDTTNPQLTGSFPVASFVVTPALALNCTLAAGQIGVAYSGSCTATGGTPPYAYSISSGFLPNGLGIDPAAGTVSGTPGVVGTSTFVVTVKDNNTAVATFAGSITVAPLTLGLTCTLPAGQAGVPYTGSCSATGGSGTYTYSISSGSLPSPLAINPTTGAISGTPTASGTSTFVVTVSDGTSTKTFNGSITIAPAALTLSCTLPAGQVGVAYTGSCTATGGSGTYTYSISSGSLPNPLAINPTTGAITGTPTANGTSTFVVSVSDGTSTKTFNGSITIAPAALSLSCTLPAGQVGVAYTGSCTATGGSGTFTYSVSSGSLPNPLAINPTTGAITGTPTASGTSTFVVSVTDGTSTKTFNGSITIAAAVLTLSCTLPAGQVGVAYTGSCTATGGSGTYTYSISSGSLPNPLAINPTTGAIAGTPTASGTSTFVVTVSDGTSTKTFNGSITIAPAALTLSCTLPAGQVGVAYTGSCTATGGSGTYSYSISSGSLPNPLAINPTTGAITGTPTASGTSTFVVTVSDGTSNTTFNGSITISPSALTLTCNLPAGQQGVAYSGSCTAGGGSPGYTYSISAGSLPSPLVINPTTGAITGTPTAYGNFAFTVKVTDNGSSPQTATQNVNINVAPPSLSLSCSVGAGQVGTAYNGSCTASGGAPPVTYTISSGALPGGLNGINSTTGAITGTPNTAGTFAFTVKVTDNAGQTATQSASITIAAATLTLTCGAAPSGIVGTVYPGANCNAGGGTLPYSYSLSGNVPPGLGINSSTGAIAGTPTTSGTFSFTVKVSDAGTQSATQSVIIQIIAALTITTTSFPNGIVGVAYSQSCSATGGTPPYTFSVASGSLPGGLSITNSSTCVISGTPTASGPFGFALKVTDGGTPAQSFTTPSLLSISINPALVITSASAPNGAVGLPYSFAISTQNGTPPYTWSVVAGSLPPLLNLNNATGLLSGNPTIAGSYSFTVKVVDATSQTATQAFNNVTISAGLAITTSSIPSAVQGTGYSATLAAANGATPYTWSITTGGLPPGLSLNSSSGAITGTPTTAGPYSFVVQAKDSSSPIAQTASQSLSIQVQPTLTFNQPSLPTGVARTAYSGACSVSGGVTQYSFSVVSGSLPPGLGLNASSCAITGTPTTAGTYNFTVKVTDSGNPQQSQTQAETITINAGLTVTSTSLPNGLTGQVYSTSLTAANGTAPLSWSLASGSALPTGLSLAGNGVISGTPTKNGTYSFTVQVSDSGSPQQSTAQTLSITIGSGLTITTAALSAGQVGIPYSAALTAANGTPNYTWALASNSTLPPGLSLNSSTGVINGNPTTANTYSFTIVVTDSSTPSQSASQAFTLLVNPASAPQVPNFTFVGLPTSVTPGQSITGATVSVSPASSAAWPITINLSFAENAAGVTSGYIDPAVKFSGGTASYTTTVSALQTSVSLPAITVGTVAGNLAFNLVVQGQNGANGSVTVPSSAPIITPGSVLITNVTATGFDVELVANSSPRDLKTANVTFSPASGAQIIGATTSTFDVATCANCATAWYAGAQSQQYGSLISLTLPFTLSGSISAIGSVSVTLTNSVGASAPVVGR